MKAYEKCLAATSTAHAPWYIVPADDKKNARLLVSFIILETLRGLGMAYPKLPNDQEQQLLAARQQLLAETV
jgi:polyphosphate kinase 2 PPK2